MADTITLELNPYEIRYAEAVRDALAEGCTAEDAVHLLIGTGIVMWLVEHTPELSDVLATFDHAWSIEHGLDLEVAAAIQLAATVPIFGDLEAIFLHPEDDEQAFIDAVVRNWRDRRGEAVH